MRRIRKLVSTEKKTKSEKYLIENVIKCKSAFPKNKNKKKLKR